jgi:hypothetical protein
LGARPRAPAEGPEVEREHAVSQPGARAAADDPDATVGCGGRRSRGALLRQDGQLAPAAAVEQEGGAKRITVGSVSADHDHPAAPGGGGRVIDGHRQVG